MAEVQVQYDPLSLHHAPMALDIALLRQELPKAYRALQAQAAEAVKAQAAQSQEQYGVYA